VSVCNQSIQLTAHNGVQALS